MPIHRQWMLFPLSATQLNDAIEEIPMNSDMKPISTDNQVYDFSGRRVDNSRTLSKGIYIVNRRKLVVR